MYNVMVNSMHNCVLIKNLLVFQEIDTALVKLLAETKSSAYLIELITAHDKRVSLDECVEALEKHSVRHNYIGYTYNCCI